MANKLEQSIKAKWNAIKGRCKHNKHYQGRVKVEFQTFNVFRHWCLKVGFRVGQVIHRINRQGNYSIDNCVFVEAAWHYRQSGIERRKFTKDQVRIIRARYLAGSSSAALGKEFGYSQRGIIQIVNLETYKDVE